MYFKWEEGNHLKAFLESPVFFHASMSTKAMTPVFLHAPSNANDIVKNTYKSILLLGYPTNPHHIASSDIYFTGNRGILHRKAWKNNLN